MKFNKVNKFLNYILFICLSFEIVSCSNDFDNNVENTHDINVSIDKETAFNIDTNKTVNLDKKDIHLEKSQNSQVIEPIQSVTFSVDRSYVNSVDYPMSMETYYASRFTNKKDNVSKPPFMVTPFGLKIKDISIDEAIEHIKSSGDNIENLQDELLMIRKKYIEIMFLSKNCCSHGLTSKLNDMKVSKDNIFKFMIDDKKMYEIQNICMIINDNDIANLVGSLELSILVRDVRNSCVCNNKDVLQREMKLFKAIIGTTDFFKKNNIIFRYKNELGEIVKNSIGRDVTNLLNILNNCP